MQILFRLQRELPKRTTLFLDNFFSKGFEQSWQNRHAEIQQTEAKLMFDLENRNKISQIITEDLLLTALLRFYFMPSSGEVCVLCRLTVNSNSKNIYSSF